MFIQVLLELVINLEPIRLVPPVLNLVLPVSKVVTMARRKELEAERLVGGGRAAVRGPVEGGGVLGVATSDEGAHGVAEEILVCEGDEGGGLTLCERVVDWDGSGSSDGADCGDESAGEGKEGELHFGDIRGLKRPGVGLRVREDAW